MWIPLDSADSIERLLSGFQSFHDACLREMAMTTETYVAENLRMTCPGHLDTTVVLFLQRQSKSLSAIEIKCERVTNLRITPSPDGSDSIISVGTIRTSGTGYCLSLSFIGGPLRGVPNSIITIGPRELPDIEIAAEAISWRSIPQGLGNKLRYRQRDEG